MSPRSWRSRVRLWFRVGLHRWQLDRQLADGCSTDVSEESALRACQLANVKTRRDLASALRGVVVDADRPVPSLLCAVPVDRRSVVPLREALLGLAERLERPGRLNPCGVARARVLITDGAGPLYNPAPKRSLSEMIWWIADGLQPCPPHEWDSPVIMKLDPERVAWTCRRCGEIATTDDPAVRPG